ncbi:importin 13 [Moniliophthora roreri MCA 2997]|uniref:Importin 13 n=1 Tax=Moniliophthora roreri (strain MCA 2997) TaxID=1381753 RepID=V2XZA3_MONRO|nr:importin 13 [Moniliophthora roreri MCA 2997]
MADLSFLPALSSFDIERAAQLILQGYGAPNPNASPEDLKRLQQELLDIQKLPEAWGLVIPFLNHQDQNIQFFGAHTAQVKIARDWSSFPQEHAESLRDMLIQLTAHSVSVGKSKVILRKLFVALSSLALKLVPHHPTRWSDWILTCVTSFSGKRAAAEHIHDFLAIVAEEVSSADLIGASKLKMQQSLLDATTMVVQAIKSSIDKPISSVPKSEVLSALRCLQAWLPHVPSSDFTPLIPNVIALLDPSADSIFIGASDTLQEIMTKSALSDGSGSRILTEPLLVWLDSTGASIVESSLRTRFVDEVSQSLCKLISALADHSTSYIAAHMASPASVSLLPSSSAVLSQQAQNKTKGQLTQTFLKLLLAYTGFPGYYGVDEDVSEMTLGFWYLLQEALWNNDFYIEEGGEPSLADQQTSGDQTTVARELYVEVVRVLRRKIKYPGPGSTWSRDQVEKFQVYRRDVGDILINAYYVIRDDMMAFFVDELTSQLTAVHQGQGSWEDVEATLHCILSIQEALDYDNTPHLPRLYSPEILGRLPTTGHTRVRRTSLSLIGTYASWFASNPDQPTTPPRQELLTNAVSYVVQALPDAALSLQAASALRNICDANRKLLAPQIGAFAELHAGLAQVPDSEKSTVMESIASVIQALPPPEEIPPVEVIVNPIVQKLMEILRSPSSLPPEAREMVILQLETLAGIAKGLTGGSTNDGLSVLEDETESEAALEAVKSARRDPRMAQLRQNILDAVRACVEVLGHDAGIGQALNELVKSITALPADITLISLPAPPLLEIVCFALQRQVTASWLSVAGILINQLSPPPPMPLKGKDREKEQRQAKERAEQDEQAKLVVSNVLPVILSTSLSTLGGPGGMENNPDIVQEFFTCLDRVAQNLPGNFYVLPLGGLDALMQCAIRALALQERYSLVAACTFLSTFIHRSYVHQSLEAYRVQLINSHGRSITQTVLSGLAGQAPRSATTNLIEMLSTLLIRCTEEMKVWLREVLFSDNFVPSRASKEDKERFLKAILGSRTLKRTREAAQQFTLIARGLEGTSFGYASLST